MNTFSFVINAFKSVLDQAQAEEKEKTISIIGSHPVLVALSGYSKNAFPNLLDDIAESFTPDLPLTIGDFKRVHVLNHFASLSEEDRETHAKKILDAIEVARSFNPESVSRKDGFVTPAELLVDHTAVVERCNARLYKGLSNLDVTKVEVERSILELLEVEEIEEPVDENKKWESIDSRDFESKVRNLEMFYAFVSDFWGYNLSTLFTNGFTDQEQVFPFSDRLKGIEGANSEETVVQLAKIGDEVLNSKQLPTMASAIIRLHQLELLLLRGDEGYATRILKYVQSLAVSSEVKGQSALLFWTAIFDATMSLKKSGRDISLNKGFLRLIDDQLEGKTHQEFRLQYGQLITVL